MDGENRKLFVYGVPLHATENDVADRFSSYGPFDDRVRIPLDANAAGKKHRGFAFVTFKSQQDAERAIAACHGEPFMDSTLSVQMATDSKQNSGKHKYQNSHDSQDPQGPQNPRNPQNSRQCNRNLVLEWSRDDDGSPLDQDGYVRKFTAYQRRSDDLHEHRSYDLDPAGKRKKMQPRLSSVENRSSAPEERSYRDAKNDGERRMTDLDRHADERAYHRGRAEGYANGYSAAISDIRTYGMHAILRPDFPQRSPRR